MSVLHQNGGGYFSGMNPTWKCQFYFLTEFFFQISIFFFCLQQLCILREFSAFGQMKSGDVTFGDIYGHHYITTRGLVNIKDRL